MSVLAGIWDHENATDAGVQRDQATDAATVFTRRVHPGSIPHRCPRYRPMLATALGQQRATDPRRRPVRLSRQIRTPQPLRPLEAPAHRDGAEFRLRHCAPRLLRVVCSSEKSRNHARRWDPERVSQREQGIGGPRDRKRRRRRVHGHPGLWRLRPKQGQLVDGR